MIELMKTLLPNRFLRVCALFSLLSPFSLRAGEWESLSQNIANSLPDLKISDAGFSATGSLVSLPLSGELFLVGIGENRVVRSTDQGKTWERVDVRATGRTYGGFSVNADVQTGGLVIWEIKKKGVPNPQMALRRATEQPWVAFEKPAVERHDGFSWGMLNWADPIAERTVLLAKRHHGAPEQWLSTDSGKSWRKLDFLCRNPGVMDSRTFVAGIDDSVEDVENGIYRSTDQGNTYEKVSDFVPTGKTPSRWDHNFYWAVSDGVIVSRDGGKTWDHTGGKVPDTLWGPYFGRTEKEMMVVGKQGFFASADGGASWKKLHDFYVPGDPKNIEKSYNAMHPCASFGWDPAHDLIYASTIYWTAERLALPKGTLSAKP